MAAACNMMRGNRWDTQQKSMWINSMEQCCSARIGCKNVVQCYWQPCSQQQNIEQVDVFRPVQMCYLVRACSHEPGWPGKPGYFTRGKIPVSYTVFICFRNFILMRSGPARFAGIPLERDEILPFRAHMNALSGPAWQTGLEIESQRTLYFIQNASKSQIIKYASTKFTFLKHFFFVEIAFGEIKNKYCIKFFESLHGEYNMLV